eukprot:Sspe_Gene.97836::Locus_71354_Transcript_2_2_Confidence_0.667_Length_801::g.97836::m.97836
MSLTSPPQHPVAAGQQPSGTSPPPASYAGQEQHGDPAIASLNLSGLDTSPSDKGPKPGIKRLNSTYAHQLSTDQSTDSNTITSFIQQSRQGKALISLWGSTTERPCFQDLAYMLRTFPQIRNYVQICSNELNTLLKSFRIMQWLDKPSEVPQEVYFCQSIVAWPITTLVQLTAFYILCTCMAPRDWDWVEVRDSFHSILTFGKGMLAAIAAATASS